MREYINSHQTWDLDLMRSTTIHGITMLLDVRSKSYVPNFNLTGVDCWSH